MEKQRQTHEFPPLYDAESKILILGSFPSIKSRAASFYYGHPQNRFWKMLGGVYQIDIPNDIESRATLLHELHFAMYDSIESCLIKGSSDASIEEVEPSDLSLIYQTGKIKKIICNGKKSYECFLKYQKLPIGVKLYCLPSTSPANAAVSLEKLVEEWGKVLKED